MTHEFVKPGSAITILTPTLYFNFIYPQLF